MGRVRQPHQKLEVEAFPWLRSDRELRRGDGLLRLSEVVQRGVPRSELWRYLKGRLKASERFIGTPFALLLMVSYALSAIVHESAPTVSAMERSLEEFIEDNVNWAFSNPNMGHKDVEDVHSFDNFWSWMTSGFLPTVLDFESAWRDGKKNMELWEELGQVPGQGFFIQHHRILGGLRLRQQRSGPYEKEGTQHTCSTTPSLYKAYNLSCVPGMGYESDPEKLDIRRMASPTAERWLYINSTFDELRAQIFDLEVEGWLDRLTRRVEIGIPVYNAEFGLYTILTINFFFSRGGQIFKAVDSLSTYATWYPYTSYALIDALFVSCLVWMLLVELYEIRTIWLKHSWTGVCRMYLRLGNAANWFSLINGIVIFILLNVNVGYTTLVNEKAKRFAEIERVQGSGTPDWNTHFELLMSALELEIHFCLAFRYVMSAFPLVIITRLFTAFSAQERLAVVTSTMTKSMPDALHFLIVFLAVFVSFMVSGATLLGKEVEAFSTLPRCANQLFRALMGDLDWDLMKPVGRYMVGIWMLFFQVLLFFVLFNILLTIVMDAYQEVTSKLQHAETLYQSIAREIVSKVHVLEKKIVATHIIERTLARTMEENGPIIHRRLAMPSQEGANCVVATRRNGRIVWEFYRRIRVPNGEDQRQFIATEEDNVEGVAVIPVVIGDEVFLHDGDSQECDIRLNANGALLWYDAEMESGPMIDDASLLEHLRTVGPSGSSYLVTPTDLMEEVESLGKRQARSLIAATVLDYYDEHFDTDEISGLGSVVTTLDQKTDQIFKAVVETLLPEDAQMSATDADSSAAPDADALERLMCPTMGDELRRLSTLASSAHQVLGIRPVLDGSNHRHTNPDDEPDVTMPELCEGVEVDVKSDWRHVLQACADAGLASVNAELRRSAVGQRGVVLRLDHHDNTVCLSIPYIGDVWLALGALCRAGSVQRVAARKRAHTARRRLDAEQREIRRRALDEHSARVQALEQQASEMRDTVEEAVGTAAELRQRLDAQIAEKRRSERDVAELESARASGVRHGQHAAHAATESWRLARHTAASGAASLENARRLACENTVLRVRLAEAQRDLEKFVEASKSEIDELRLQHAKTQRELDGCRSVRRRAEHEDQRDLPWLVGRSDAIVRVLQRDRSFPRSARGAQRFLRRATELAQSLAAA
eukprot:TRINITY_DN23978_c0_g1_i1.p1 TRINITY_DN23978_c0_g1~~TRINITY_DN23978_c0_g1_i1.p1  ORF type:complete len:1165 (-),score=153.74 TRINITY_DN23978_c0_g1_i1:425-3919(-)